MKFTADGEVNLKTEKRKFSITVDAPNEKVARDVVYSRLGSAHGSKRSAIVITTVKKGE